MKHACNAAGLVKSIAPHHTKLSFQSKRITGDFSKVLGELETVIITMSINVAVNTTFAIYFPEFTH